MSTVYIVVVCLLVVLAMTDLMVGVSNDAVNFLSSAFGAKAASRRVILTVASAGVLIGAISGSGMMDIARHGMFHPEYFSFHAVMCIYLSVVVCDVIILDTFNSLGMPTSTTVSMVFELFGSSFMACWLMTSTGQIDASMGDLLKTDTALTMIVAIFLSVAIAFLCGSVVMWFTRLLFSFKVAEASSLKKSIFSAICGTIILYFILIRGVATNKWVADAVKEFINGNLISIIGCAFVLMMGIMMLIDKKGGNVLKIVVLMGTFSLALSFAGNDLVNFIGVTLASCSSLFDYLENGAANGVSPTDFKMISLQESYSANVMVLGGAGMVMIFAMCFTRKAQRVLQRTLLLAGRGDADTAGGTTAVSRSIVRKFSAIHSGIEYIIPKKVNKFIDQRFDNSEAKASDSAFDALRACINLVLSGLLIAFGTQHKLPLSTTYVAFTLSMGSALADRAWGRESAVYRLTGVFSVVGGWFATAGVAFVLSATMCFIILSLGTPAMVVAVLLVCTYMFFSFKKQNKVIEKSEEEKLIDVYLYGKDPKASVEAIKKHVSISFSRKINLLGDVYNTVFTSFYEQNLKPIRKAADAVVDNKASFKSRRKQFMTGINMLPDEESLAMNAWFHLLSNEISQMFSTMNRIVEPMKEHTDNNFTPLPEVYYKEFSPLCAKVAEYMKETGDMIARRDFSRSIELSEEARDLKKDLSDLRKKQTDRLKTSGRSFSLEMIYLNLIIETHELLSQMRNVLRGAVKFYA